jgi:segregation and condensation protein A
MIAEVEGQINLELEEDKALLSSYKVKQDVFEGPFDLMLAMIDKGEIDLYRVSLSQITQGFIEYIKTIEKMNIVIAGEFLLMAAYLLEMKSKMLLPQPVAAEEEEELVNVEEELLKRLAEYKVYKGLAQSLKDRKEVFQKVYTRYSPGEELEGREIFLVDVSIKDLVSAFKRVWDIAESREKTGEIIAETFSVKDKIEEILARIDNNPNGLNFSSLFERYIKGEIIVTFLAILELIKRKIVRIMQGESFGEIFIFMAEK